MTTTHKKSFFLLMIKIIIGAFFILFVDMIFFITFPYLNTLFVKIVLGWLPFLKRNLTQVTIDLEIMLQAIIAVCILFGGGHFLYTWIYKHRTGKRWKKLWTCGTIISIIVLFSIGTASAGIMKFTEVISKKGVLMVTQPYNEDLRQIINHASLLHQTDKDLKEFFYNSQRSQLLKRHLDTESTGLLKRYNGINFKYLSVISKDQSLVAAIRYPSSNKDIVKYHQYILVEYWSLHQHNERRRYNVLSLEEIIQSIEKGVIPDDRKT